MEYSASKLPDAVCDNALKSFVAAYSKGLIAARSSLDSDPPAQILCIAKNAENLS